VPILKRKSHTLDPFIKAVNKAAEDVANKIKYIQRLGFDISKASVGVGVG
jgi:hypothetical protein